MFSRLVTGGGGWFWILLRQISKGYVQGRLRPLAARGMSIKERSCVQHMPPARWPHMGGKPNMPSTGSSYELNLNIAAAPSTGRYNIQGQQQIDATFFVISIRHWPANLICITRMNICASCKISHRFLDLPRAANIRKRPRRYYFSSTTAVIMNQDGTAYRDPSLHFFKVESMAMTTQ